MNTEISLSSTINDQMVEISIGKIELRDDRTKQKWTVEINPFLILLNVGVPFFNSLIPTNSFIFRGFNSILNFLIITVLHWCR